MAASFPVLQRELERIEPNARFTTTDGKVFKSSSGALYFAKLGTDAGKSQYLGEAESLQAMSVAAPGLAPRFYAFGTDPESNQTYMITEYKYTTALSHDAAVVLGRRLATEMHMYKSTRGFGFGVPTYCGTTRLENGWWSTWEDCFTRMIGGLLTNLRNQGEYDELVRKGEELRKIVIPKLLAKLVIQPVLLHGDLWRGNTGTDRSTGLPVIFDPSSYYGHNEADLAIARLFGGIPQVFYAVYHSFIPKTPPVEEYELRRELYELFHCLNHTVMFGEVYARESMQRVDKLLAAFPGEGLYTQF